VDDPSRAEAPEGGRAVRDGGIPRGSEVPVHPDEKGNDPGDGFDGCGDPQVGQGIQNTGFSACDKLRLGGGGGHILSSEKIIGGLCGVTNTPCKLI